MLAPVYELLFGKYQPSLELSEDQISISYKTYKSDNADDMQCIIDQKLTPGMIPENLVVCTVKC